MYLLEEEPTEGEFVPYVLPIPEPSGIIKYVPIKYYSDDGKEWMRRPK